MLLLTIYCLIATGLYLGLMLLSMKYLEYPWYLFPIILGGLALAFGILKLTQWVLDKAKLKGGGNNGTNY